MAAWRRRAASISFWALALAVALLPALATAELHILSPRPREMFVRLPVPVLVRVDGDMVEDPDLRVVLHVDGVKVLDTPASILVETSLKEMSEGQHSVAFSVGTDSDSNDMIHYIPPKDGARPRFPHWLLSPREGEWEATSDPTDPNKAASLLERRQAAADKYPRLFAPDAPSQPSGQPGASGKSGDFGESGEAGEAGGGGGLAWAALEAYAQRQAKIVNDPQLLREARFLVARHYPTSGLGNMFQSLVSEFLVAFLT
ncbi:hypothetical protein T484DRAFT_1768896, partial [Baffinella frigidus]